MITRSVDAGDSRSSKNWIKGPRNTMMTESFLQDVDYVTLVFNESPNGAQGVVAAIAHDHGSFLKLAIIRRRDSVDSGLLGSKLGESTSETREFAVMRLDC